MPSLSIALMHAPWVPERRAMLLEILRRLGGREALQRYTTRFEVVEDVRREGVWPTGRRAWKAAVTKASHHLVLQDDMVPCAEFLPGVLAVLEANPDEIVCMFTMRRKAVAEAGRRDVRWFTSPEGTWGGATVMPTEMAWDFLGWERAHIRPEYKHDDGRTALYAMAHGLLVWNTVPSLLQHGLPSSSLLGHNNRLRVAPWWLGETPATSVDWTRGLENPVRSSGTITLARSWAKAALPGHPVPQPSR